MIRKILTVSLLLFLGLVLTGCSLPIGQKKPVTLKYWGLWEPENVMSALITEYQKSNPNVQIEYSKKLPKDYRDRLQNSLAQGQGPDIFRIHNTWIPMFRNDLASLPVKIIDTKTLDSSLYKVSQKDLKIGTEYFAIPLGIDTLGLFYNTDLFKSAGLDLPPANWEDFPQIAKKLTTRNEDRILIAGAALGTVSNIDHWQEIVGLMLLQNGVDTKSLNDSSTTGALDYYTNFAKGDERIWDDTLPASTEAFAQGKVAMYFAPSWRVFDIKAINPNLNFKVARVPQIVGGDVNYASYWVEGVSKKSANSEAAWAFLKFLSSKESLAKLYTEETKTRLFGEPYPRPDMAENLKQEPLVSPFISMAKTADSWYLASFTNDGSTGINSKIGKYFEDAINLTIIGQKDPTEILSTLSLGVSKILSDYQITSK